MNGLIKASDVNQAGHLQIAGVDALELATKYQTRIQKHIQCYSGE
ncbi:hypothetical protein ME784_17310 [Lactobacillus delbrueckii]|nr:hypothetical protein [Lactobacillus delbrueckii]GHN21216.1 hypothetical protein ME784_17310 [Lactobacillus delbrueckii]